MIFRPTCRSISHTVMLVTAIFLQACASRPPLPLGTAELPRMYGRWYIIATIPNWFERGMIGPVDVFSARPDGDIREDFYVRRGSFSAPESHYVVHDWVRPGTGNAHWRVQVAWPIDLPFLLLYVDPEYSCAMFGEENRALGWIYCREPTVEEPVYRSLLLRFRSLGYDDSQFRKIVQKPEQIGQPGYWSDGIEQPAARSLLP
jgi:apolipoprotein D and lipocalin family protein